MLLRVVSLALVSCSVAHASAAAAESPSTLSSLLSVPGAMLSSFGGFVYTPHTNATASTYTLFLNNHDGLARFRDFFGGLEKTFPATATFAYSPLTPNEQSHFHRYIVIVTLDGPGAVEIAESLQKSFEAAFRVGELGYVSGEILDQSSVIFPNRDSKEFRMVKFMLLLPYIVVAYVVSRNMFCPRPDSRKKDKKKTN